MSAYLYDNAIVDYFRKIITDDRVYITPTDNVVRTIARLNDDEFKLPLISLTRTGVTLLPSQFTMRFGGIKTEYIYEGEGEEAELQKIRKVQAMPIKIAYNIDVWTRNREENDNFVRELVFFLSTHPTIEVSVPYGWDGTHNFNLFLGNEVTDNSDIISHKEKGEMFRQTLTAYVDDAYLWKSTLLDEVKVDPVIVEILQRDGKVLYTEEIKINESEE